MTINIGINETDRADAASAVREVLGETYALYFKTHGYHWNVTGPRFSELHNLFMTQYTEMWTALDALAERIRSLGHFAPSSSQQMMETATIQADDKVPDANDMVRQLAKGHETVARVAKSGVKAAEKAGDIVTVDLLTQRADLHEKTAWMLRSSV